MRSIQTDVGAIRRCSGKRYRAPSSPLGLRGPRDRLLACPSFEWDSRKAKRNFQKHRVRFEEACLIFADLLSLTVPDPDYTNGNRFITIGKSGLGRLLIVAHTEREETIR